MWMCKFGIAPTGFDSCRSVFTRRLAGEAAAAIGSGLKLNRIDFRSFRTRRFPRFSLGVRANVHATAYFALPGRISGDFWAIITLINRHASFYRELIRHMISCDVLDAAQICFFASVQTLARVDWYNANTGKHVTAWVVNPAKVTWCFWTKYFQRYVNKWIIPKTECRRFADELFV